MDQELKEKAIHELCKEDKPMTEDEHFCLSLVNTFQSLGSERKAFLKLKIQELIYTMQFNPNPNPNPNPMAQFGNPNVNPAPNVGPQIIHDGNRSYAQLSNVQL